MAAADAILATVLILLPPSEGKAEPPAGGSIELDSLVFGERLRPERTRLCSALAEIALEPREQALERMGLSSRQSGDVDRNADLLRAPAAPAAEVYSGVLYDRLGFDSLPPRARSAAHAHVLIASALWGMLRPGDRIPWYRLSIKSRPLDESGLAAFWRGPLSQAMLEEGLDRPGRLILDMRSAAYAAAWKPREAEIVSVRAFTGYEGTRKAVSHMAKATRGRVTRVVLSADPVPRDPEATAHLLESSGMRVELRPGYLDVIESA